MVLAQTLPLSLTDPWRKMQSSSLASKVCRDKWEVDGDGGGGQGRRKAGLVYSTLGQAQKG